MIAPDSLSAGISEDRRRWSQMTLLEKAGEFSVRWRISHPYSTEHDQCRAAWLFMQKYRLLNKMARGERLSKSQNNLLRQILVNKE